MRQFDDRAALALAATVRETLDRHDPADVDLFSARVSGSSALASELVRRIPDAKVFGSAVLHAAVRKVPAGTCRWSLAIADARVHREPLPRFTAANKILLGAEPCNACKRAIVRDLAARIHTSAAAGGWREPGTAGRRGRGGSGGSSSFSRRATSPPAYRTLLTLQPEDLHPVPCSTCRDARAAIKSLRQRGFVASAQIPAHDRDRQRVMRAITRHRPVVVRGAGVI